MFKCPLNNADFWVAECPLFTKITVLKIKPDNHVMPNRFYFSCILTGYLTIFNLIPQQNVNKCKEGYDGSTQGFVIQTWNSKTCRSNGQSCMPLGRHDGSILCWLHTPSQSKVHIARNGHWDWLKLLERGKFLTNGNAYDYPQPVAYTDLDMWTGIGL